MTDFKINLLIIDDDEINIFIVKKIVEKTGYNVNVVDKNNGQLGIDYLLEAALHTEQYPKIILVDLNMPIVNGWAFLDAYQKLNIPHKTDMYMLSSSVYENDIEKAKSYEVIKGFISKPLSISKLSKLLGSITP